MFRHVSSRWLSLKAVLIRIVEQWANLRQYFLVYLPKQKNFGEIRNTDRYSAIEKKFKSDDETKLYMAFATYLAGIIEPFLVKFQSNDSPALRWVW